MIAEGKEEREFNGERYVMETGLVADISLVHAWKGDTEGNLVYRKTARNFNPMMATAGRITIAEVEHLVEPGELDGDHIVTPGIYVQRIVHVPTPRSASSSARRASATRPDISESRPWLGPAIRWRSAPRKELRTASTSISASAFRRWCRTTSRPA